MEEEVVRRIKFMNFGSYQKAEIIFNVVFVCIAVRLVLDFTYESKFKNTAFPNAIKQPIVESENRSNVKIPIPMSSKNISSHSKNPTLIENIDHRNTYPYHITGLKAADQDFGRSLQK